MSLLFNATGLLLLRYLVDHVGIAAGIAGLLIGGAKIYDAITDPLMGSISDRTKSSAGRRRPYLLLGSFISGLSFILLFSLAGLKGSEYILLFTGMALLFNATGYTIFNVPYLAMPAEMTQSYHERTSLMSFRVASVAVGQLASSFVGPLLLVAYGGGAGGHTAMAMVLGPVIFLGGAICFWMTRNAPIQEQIETSVGFVEQFRTAMENRPFVLLLGVKITQLLGLAIFISMLPFLFTRVLKVSDTYLGFYFLAQASFMLISQPIWVRVSRNFGKRCGYFVAVAIYTSAALTWLLASEGEPLAGIMARGVVAGLGAGGLLLTGQSMLPDTMEYDYQISGVRREGILAGVYTTVEKISFSFGPAIAGIMLGAAGYIQSADASVEQPEAARMVIYACVAILPVVVTLSGSLLLLGYKITEESLQSGKS
jgi:GPH family glycoside/pentoside/hexuronide:cation symporter